jgi:hypothetical protein
MNQAMQLSAQATDADQDALTFSWAQTAPASPQGSFSASHSSSTAWTAPTVSSPTGFTLTVTVSDGRGLTSSAPVVVYAKTSPDPSFVADVLQILSGCESCHGPPHTVADLNLSPAGAYEGLVGVPALVACAPQLRVKPGDPDNSVLFEVISSTKCGPRMPYGSPGYFDSHPDQVALIRTWILNGAPNN